jgi:hypothetical protein
LRGLQPPGSYAYGIYVVHVFMWCIEKLKCIDTKQFSYPESFLRAVNGARARVWRALGTRMTASLKAQSRLERKPGNEVEANDVFCHYYGHYYGYYPNVSIPTALIYYTFVVLLL